MTTITASHPVHITASHPVHTTASHPVHTTAAHPGSAPASPTRIPLSRIVGVELRKTLDTRAGFWLLASIGIAAVLATAAVVGFAPTDQFTYSTFTLAVGFPMSVILPMVAILSVTAEWSQRSGLTTFTLVPHRGRILQGKAIAALAIAVISMLIAFPVGALGNIVGSAIHGVPTMWDHDVSSTCCTWSPATPCSSWSASCSVSSSAARPPRSSPTSSTHSSHPPC